MDQERSRRLDRRAGGAIARAARQALQKQRYDQSDRLQPQPVRCILAASSMTDGFGCRTTLLSVSYGRPPWGGASRRLPDAPSGRLSAHLVDAGLRTYILQNKERAVPGSNCRLFEQAMRERKPVFHVYAGYSRELCPLILGHSQHQEKELTYQFGGQTKLGLLREGQWRCLWLAKVSAAQLHDGPWRTGSSHTQPQGFVEIVDLDVNPLSPYRPKRRPS